MMVEAKALSVTRGYLNRRLRWLAAAAMGIALGFVAPAAPEAQASIGYEPDASKPVIGLDGEQPLEVAIDQSNQRIYVAMISRSASQKEPGQIEQLESTGVATAASPFTTTSQPLYSGVAVNPTTHGIYAAEFVASTPFGSFGTSRVDQFSSLGTLGTQFATGNGAGVAPKIAADSSGDLYYPNSTAHTVQVFSATGVVQETISCGGCPGGGFSGPTGVAFDSNDDLYVVDPGSQRVLKFTHAGGSYVFASVLQSGRSAVAVGVDPSDNSVLVGDYTGGSDYHVVAYNSSGVQFDDFGAGIFAGSDFGIPGAGQIAVNATTHKLYISDPNANALRVFARVTISPPTATTNPASPVGQVTAKMNATINANRHATIDCHFEYTDDADFQVHSYASATAVPCSLLPAGSESTPVSATPAGLSPSTTYHYRVVAASNAGSVNGSSQTFTTLALTPATVTTGSASAVTQTVATLAGKVNPHGGTVSDCKFEYGEGLSYAKSIPCLVAVGPVTADVAESAKVTGLSPKTSYHYRLSVTSNAGTVVGDGEEVTTLPLAPTIVTEAPSGITQAAATIAGTINPNGGAANCHFEYGPTTSYGSVGGCATDPGEGQAAVIEQLNLTGLPAGSTYHYRLVGTNSGGTTNGADRSFTTPPTPPIITPETSPTGPVAAPPKPLKCKKGFQKKKVRGKLKCVKKKKRRRRH